MITPRQACLEFHENLGRPIPKHDGENCSVCKEFEALIAAVSKDVGVQRDEAVREAGESRERIGRLEARLNETLHQLEEKAFDVLQAEINEWQRKTFPESTEDTVLEHLTREVKELCDTRDPVEAADSVMLLVAFADKRGLCLLDLVRKKFEINKKRKWGEPDAQGVREHIR